MRKYLERKYLAELVGTFLLVVCGVGSAVLARDQIGNIGISLAFGLALYAMAYTIGPISGCHVNPAVTLGLAVTGQMPTKDALGYVVAQVIGATVGAAVVLLIALGRSGGYDVAANGLFTNGYGSHSPDGYGLLHVLLAEVVMTFLLVLTVLGATHLRVPARSAGVQGLVLALIHLVTIPISNTSVNPARSLATALFAGGWWAIGQLWLFILAPTMGGVLAALVYGVVRMHAPGLLAVEPEEEAELPADTTDGDVGATLQ